MFEKTSRLAEKLATHVSRRDFLGRLGQGALAAVVGGVLALPGQAQASDQCCVHINVLGGCVFYKVGGRCDCFNRTSCANVPAGCIQVNDCHKGFASVG
jgi:hypothetical protein